MTALEQRVLDAIDGRALLDCLARLIGFRSEGGRETPIQEHVAELMAGLGMAVDRWGIDIDRLRTHPACTVEIEREHALGVVGRYGRGNGRTLVLNGHVDVVPAGEPQLWSVPPWQATIRDGRVYSRGAADMKGGLCCALFALRAIREAGIGIAGSVLIQSVVGEEDGGLGTLAAIERGHTGDAAIVLEPTELSIVRTRRPDGRVVRTRWWEFFVAHPAEGMAHRTMEYARSGVHVTRMIQESRRAVTDSHRSHGQRAARHRESRRVRIRRSAPSSVSCPPIQPSAPLYGVRPHRQSAFDAVALSS